LRHPQADRRGQSSSYLLAIILIPVCCPLVRNAPYATMVGMMRTMKYPPSAWLLSLILLTACRSDATSYREPLVKQYDTPSAASASVPVAPVATPAPTPTLIPALSPTPSSVLVDKEPGATILLNGSESQVGTLSGGTWCYGGIAHVGDVFDLYSAPGTALRVVRGTVLILDYTGGNTVRSISATFYPFPTQNPRARDRTAVPNGGYYLPPTGSGQKADIHGSGSHATFPADLPPGEYMIITNIEMEDGIVRTPVAYVPNRSNCHEWVHFHILVE